ncbi:Pentapeptide repeat-containing protein [Quadrisphaera granulorum]|uniref:Pentapeptide repeat protein n=1 Tax=Quadrisphaera granulorum TaxID=317664 RepID=A0A316B1B4_9ACTN|nr:pentapeptide repeat-containing protein [Quadrisphaera granulorum]PWJ56317.1 pentapeptide repeat protein [Quadrisphaera granulorum]SZE94951.1 Pentapeptide repeat-containing protein [Quadrisphaera granulorum]
MPDRSALRADCGRCAGLCCVLPAFSRSADFAFDKPAGMPCPNLRADARCRIHDELVPRGFPGCVTFDCFGAGQRAVEVVFGQRPGGPPAPADLLREAPDLPGVLAALRGVHEVLWHLTEACELLHPGRLRDEVAALRAHVEEVAGAGREELVEVDVAAQRRAAGPLLERTSRALRAAVPGRLARHRGADLSGKRWRGARLRGADLRGALLLGADLRDADLRLADLLGADLRAADLRGADLTGALFLTTAQLDGARGDATTRLPAGPVPRWADGRPREDVPAHGV